LKLFFKNAQEAVKSLLYTLKQRYFDKFGKTYRAVLVDDKTPQLDDKEIVDLILSPKYYWVKIEELPVKYAFQAREYAPSLFDGYIPEGDYSYKAVKKEGKFLLFAYNTKDILESLQALGVKMSQVHSVYFAQTELLDRSLKINELNALITHNGKVIKVPLFMAGECEVQKNEPLNVTVSKNKIKLGKFVRFYEKRGAFAGIIYVLAFLIVLFAGEFLYLKSVANAKAAQKEEIIQRYSLPPTELQLKALSKQYDKINNQQKAIRSALGNIFKFPLLSDEYFKNIDLSSSEISLTLHINNKNRANIVQDYLKKTFVIDEFKDDSLDIKIKMRYE
jgi:hypothetical protein